METDVTGRVDAVRRFNRFYTRRIGVLQDRHLRSPFTLTEARVLFEVAHRGRTTPTELAGELGLDMGYLSRILRRFGERGLVRREPSAADRRQSIVALTGQGRETFAALDAAASAEVRALLGGLPEGDRRRLVDAMGTIEDVLGGGPLRGPFVLRQHRPGDIGWIVQRHGELYWQEYGWDETFEALVAGIAADFIRNFNPARERCWIAEADGERLGSVVLVQNADDPEHTAQLRLLLVEPRARGLGLGRTLVQACTAFAREAGYARITLWTNAVLHAARRIYEREGYRLVHEAPHHSWGHDLVEQTWEMVL